MLLKLSCLFVLVFYFSGCQPNPYRQGEDIFKFHCGGCHGDDGSGLAKLIPPIDTSVLHLDDPVKLICLIRNGLPFDSLTRQQMPANKIITETEMTNLVNYLGVKYLDMPQVLKAEETQRMYSTCQSTKGTE